MNATNARHAQRGQAIVILTFGMIVLLAMAALIVDAGNAFAQQRVTQNGIDASSESGAIVLAQNLIAKGDDPLALPPKTDQDVFNAVVAAAANNQVATPSAFYTDFDGNRLDPPIEVGSLGAVPPPLDAYGVEAGGSRSFNTFFGGVFGALPGGSGMFQFTASAKATAIAGQIQQICPADVPCGFLPVTFPTSLTLCDGSNKQVDFGTEWPLQKAPALTAQYEVIIPLCATGAGSVGWLDIDPHDPSCNGNGATFLACEITTPGNTGLDLPIWIHTITGNTNSVQVQDALNEFIGETVQIPFYECIGYDVGQVGPNPECDDVSGNPVGNNLYYRIVAVVNFVLDRAYIQANNPECNELPGQPFVGGNGSTGCLKGWFVNALNTGPLGLPSDFTPWAAYGVQLIR